MLKEYFILFLYAAFCLFVVILLLVLSYLFVYQMWDHEKLSSYECGFNPFGDARSQFQVRFYVVAILFVVFDIEITFLLPWVCVLRFIDLSGFLCLFLFSFLLVIGLLYEWSAGVLDR